MMSLFGDESKSPPARASASDPKPLTVTQVNQRARQLLERQLGVVQVVGEVSNPKVVGGHCYFGLKDSGAQLAAVMFRREVQALRFRMETGIQVIATGKLTVYGPYGRYQMVVERLEPQGSGALQLAFEQLKARLQQEGLFAPERKRQLPALPNRVAVVTSPTGAVIRDIMNVAWRRYPRADVLLFPARVQGSEAAPGLAAAIRRASAAAATHGIDVLIVARGGGSLEDLWAFNDEQVVRAIAAAPIPVVSAVGHETDFTICDFVADKRAPTPSAASELVFPLWRDTYEHLVRWQQRGRQLLSERLTSRRHRIAAAAARLGSGRQLIQDAIQRLAWSDERLQRARQRHMEGRRAALQERRLRLQALHPRVRLQHSRERLRAARRVLEAFGPRHRLGEARGRLERYQNDLHSLERAHIELLRDRLARLGRALHALSPLAVLERGYSIVRDDAGQVVRKANDLNIGQSVHIRLAEGGVVSTIERFED